MPDRIAYKVLTTADAAALDAGVFSGSPIDLADGYIHLSTAAQLNETVARHFGGQAALTLAVVDLAALGAAIRWEPSRHGQLFPHIYGALPASAIVARRPLELLADGTVIIPV